MRQLFEDGLVSEMMTPYADQNRGKREFEEQMREGNGGNVRQIDGKYYRSGGTLAIDYDTFEVIPGDSNVKSNGLYAMGACVTGQMPVLEGIGALDTAVKHIASSLVKKISHEKHAPELSPLQQVSRTFDLEDGSKIRPVIFIHPKTREVTVIVDPGISDETRGKIEPRIRDSLGTNVGTVSFVQTDSIPPELARALNERGISFERQ